MTKDKILLKLVYALLAWASLVSGAQATHRDSVTVMTLWGGKELEAFEGILDTFEKRTEVAVRVESAGRDLSILLMARLEAGNPPDLAVIPNPGQMRELARRGHLIPLDFLKPRGYPKAFIESAQFCGRQYGLFLSADVKSLVWYRPRLFKEGGYEIPRSWSDMVALSEHMATEGKTPWSIGLESGAASGWPGTDWIEDIFLRLHGPDAYDRWVEHEISWQNPLVKEAWETFGQILFNEDYVFGGIMGCLSINFADAALELFTEPPGCLMHRQGTFMQSFIRGNYPLLAPGRDYDAFPLPSIKGGGPAPLVASGDLISAFRDTREVRDLLSYLASPEAQSMWAKATGKLALHVDVPISTYSDPISAKAAELLTAAEVVKFDASDMMPAVVGSGAFWTGVLDYASGMKLDDVLARIENAAQRAYKGGQVLR
ncbi:MAG: Extracellular solute-binding protein family 1 [Synergistales bacterium 54_24]|nr:MAG: Extracellular solute-binding protein family 1 [Synergistales bacterium 54_24]HAF51030.1 ABC transporter substrate-binding protein [Synergistaceae bacterium]